MALFWNDAYGRFGRPVLRDRRIEPTCAGCAVTLPLHLCLSLATGTELGPGTVAVGLIAAHWLMGWSLLVSAPRFSLVGVWSR